MNIELYPASAAGSFMAYGTGTTRNHADFLVIHTNFLWSHARFLAIQETKSVVPEILPTGSFQKIGFKF